MLDNISRSSGKCRIGYDVLFGMYHLDIMYGTHRYITNPLEGEKKPSKINFLYERGEECRLYPIHPLPSHLTKWVRN